MAACLTCPLNCPLDCPSVDVWSDALDPDPLYQRFGDYDAFGSFATREVDYYTDSE